LYTFLKKLLFENNNIKKKEHFYIYIHKIEKEQDMAVYSAAKSVYIHLTEPLAIYQGAAGRSAARKKIVDAIGEDNVIEHVGKIMPKFETKGKVLI